MGNPPPFSHCPWKSRKVQWGKKWTVGWLWVQGQWKKFFVSVKWATQFRGVGNDEGNLSIYLNFHKNSFVARGFLKLIKKIFK